MTIVRSHTRDGDPIYFKTAQDATAHIDALLKSPLLAQLQALLKAGLVPLIMAGDLGELERKAACDSPIVTFTMDEPSLKEVPVTLSASDSGWETFFGESGFTKASNMLTVTRRSSC